MKAYCHNVWNGIPCAYRSRVIRGLISDFDADICFFQECGPKTMRIGDGESPLPVLMSDVYTEAYCIAAGKNYTPIFYKTSKYNELDSGYFLYDGFNDSNSKSFSWAVLEEKETGKRFIAVSTHLWWRFDSEEDNRQRLQNVAQLKEFLDDIISKTGLPVIIGGDFNNGLGTPQGDEPYQKMLKDGFCDMRLAAEETTDMRTCVDNYPQYLPDKTTAPRSNPDCTIDYIFTYNADDIKLKKFDVLNNEMARRSSDHSPLLGIFEF